MKKYPKTYENVYSTDRPKNKVKLNIDRVSAGDLSLNEYTTLFKDFLQDFYSDLFDRSVKFSWLRRQFKYGNERTTPQMRTNSVRFCNAFMKYMRRVVGMDPQVITRSKFFQNIEPYFDELYPGFDEGNPFENPEYYKFPFSHVTLDFLPVVHQMDDRMALLNIAEEKEMSYAVFLDYILNHVYSANDELGYNKYIVRINRDRNYLFQIEDMDKKLKVKETK